MRVEDLVVVDEDDVRVRAGELSGGVEAPDPPMFAGEMVTWTWIVAAAAIRWASSATAALFIQRRTPGAC